MIFKKSGNENKIDFGNPYYVKFDEYLKCMEPKLVKTFD